MKKTDRQLHYSLLAILPIPIRQAHLKFGVSILISPFRGAALAANSLDLQRRKLPTQDAMKLLSGFFLKMPSQFHFMRNTVITKIKPNI